MWLAAHNLPATEAALIYRYGRSGLRSEVRSFMFVRLLDIVRKRALEMNGIESTLNTWFVNRVWSLEKAMYKAAVDDKNNWKKDLCSWRPDPDVTKAYNLYYDYQAWCGNTPLVLFSAPPAPVKSYFLAAALKNTYGKSVSNFPNGAAVLAKTGSSTATQVGVAIGSGVAAGAAAFGLVVGTATALLPYSVGMGSAATFSALGAATGPFIIVTIMAIIGVIAAFQVIEQQKNYADLATLDSMLYEATTFAPDLRSWLGNVQSVNKMATAFVSATLPEFESTQGLVNDNLATFTMTRPNGSKLTNVELDWLDWDGSTLTGFTNGGWFNTVALSITGVRTVEFTPTLRYIDWGFPTIQAYTASRFGADRFIVTKGAPSAADNACPADPITGVSIVANVTKCLSYVTRQLRMIAPNGEFDTVTLSSKPVFTSFYQAGFATGVPKTFQITADGGPVPVITMNGGTLPQGITFQGSDIAGPGKANLVFTGTAAAGTYNPSFLATSSGGTANLLMDVFVGPDVKITSKGTINATVGVPMSFDVTTTGSGVALTLDSGALPAGLTLTDKGTGVATIAGTVNASVTAATYTFAVKAQSNVAQDTKTFNLIVAYAPKPVITSPLIFSVLDGVLNTNLITTSGAVTPVSFTLPCGDLPYWMTLMDNGDGTGKLVGTPPPNASGTFTPYIRASASGDGTTNACGPNVAPRHTITYDPTPFFTIPGNSRNLISGFPIDVLLSSNQSFTQPVGVEGGLPPGVTLSRPGNLIPALTGTPVKGSGGNYELILTLTNPFGTARFPFRLSISDSPTIISAGAANFVVGQQNTFRIETTGYPKQGAANSPGMIVIMDGGTMPAGVTLSDRNAAGYETGTGILSGNPPASAIGTYTLNILAKNDDIPKTGARQFFMLYVIKPGDLNADGVVDCKDIDFVKSHMHTRVGEVSYDNRADADGDGVIDGKDVSAVEKHIAKGVKCN